MKTRVYLFIGKALAMFFIFGVNFVSFAQPPGGPPPSGGDTNVSPCWNPDCVPIDGGVGFLIAAGAVLGVKKIRNHKKQSRK
jgi:hypothetical protein